MKKINYFFYTVMLFNILLNNTNIYTMNKSNKSTSGKKISEEAAIKNYFLKKQACSNCIVLLCTKLIKPKDIIHNKNGYFITDKIIDIYSLSQNPLKEFSNAVSYHGFTLYLIPYTEDSAKLTKYSKYFAMAGAEKIKIYIIKNKKCVTKNKDLSITIVQDSQEKNDKNINKKTINIPIYIVSLDNLPKEIETNLPK